MIPQTDPHAGYLALQSRIDAAIRRVLASGWYVLGEEVDTFEREFADYLNVSHAVGVASGTDAITLALMASGIGPGDEVITVSHTAVATVVGIERAGAVPVFVDIDASTYGMNPELLAGALSSRTRAIVPVHLYGLPVDIAPILQFAREHGLKVIEDCAQAHGAEVRVQKTEDRRQNVEDGRGTTKRAKGPKEEAWQKVGSFGDAAAFSFYPTKNLGAFGDGGAVATGSADIAEKVRLLRQYGWRERYVSSSCGMNSRLDAIQAAVLREKLKTLDADNASRRRVAGIYDERLSGVDIVTPAEPQGRRHVYHQYVVRVPDRDVVRARLLEMGIGTAVHYPVPVHCQPAYGQTRQASSMSATEDVCPGILSLPMYPQLSSADAEKVCEALCQTIGMTSS